MTTAEQSQAFGTMFDYMRRQAESEAQARYAHSLHEMEQRILRRDYPNLKARVQEHVDEGEPIPEDLRADYVNATILTGNHADLIKGFKPKKKESKGSIENLFTPEVKEFFKDEAEKIANTGLVPALALDAIGAFGNYGSIDSLLTPVAMVGGMAGYYGGRNHLVKGPVLAGVAYGVGKLVALVLDHLKDGKINEAQPDALKYLAAYALAALAGKTVQYVKDNWDTKTKPAV